MAIILFSPVLNKKYPFYVLSFGVLFLFLALRYDFGNDYLSYQRMHEALNAGWIPNLEDGEIFYKTLNLVIPNFYLFIAILSLFYICVIAKLIMSNLNRNLYWFSIFLLLINPYLFLVHLSSLRQTLAICFIIIAVHYGIGKKPIMYLLFVTIAAGFHQSALIILPVYFLLNQRKLNIKKLSVIMITVLLFLATPMLDIIIMKVLGYFPNNYLYYFNQDIGNSLRATLISSFYFFLILFNINKLDGKELIYGKLSLVATIISLLAYKVSMITRIGMYFDIFLIISIPLIFTKMKNGNMKVILFILMVGIYFLRYWSFFNNEIWMESYSTYRTILNK